MSVIERNTIPNSIITLLHNQLTAANDALAEEREMSAMIPAFEQRIRQLEGALREAIEALEFTHPMNPDEPCVVYEAWIKAQQALGDSLDK